MSPWLGVILITLAFWAGMLVTKSWPKKHRINDLTKLPQKRKSLVGGAFDCIQSYKLDFVHQLVRIAFALAEEEPDADGNVFVTEEIVDRAYESLIRELCGEIYEEV